MKVKILVVDDSESIRSALVKDLNENGYETLEAKDGIEGLKVFQEQQSVIGAVFSDVNMPNLDGLGMIQKIMESCPNHGVPILMLTTEANTEMKAKAKVLGVRAWITKPYVKEKLIAAAQKLVVKDVAGGN